MNKLLLCVSLCAVLWASFVLSHYSAGAAEDMATKTEFDALYERWHRGLETNRNVLSQPFFFQTEIGPPELVSAVKEIKATGLAMANYLAEKIAAGATSPQRIYADVLLLEKVSGVDLLHAEDKPARQQNFAENIAMFTTRFREEWRAGVYKDPSLRVSLLCESRLPKEKNTKIEPNDVVALRRYGIYGLPELIRQIRKNNSKHAFAAYLMVTGQAEEYGEYIIATDKLFTTREEKILHIERTVERLKENGGGKVDVVQKIAAALKKE